MDLDDLSEDQRDALSLLVRERAEEIAEEAVATGTEVTYLLQNGWSEAEIADRLTEAVPEPDDTGAEGEPATVDLLTAYGPYASWRHQGRTIVHLVSDAAGKPQLDLLGRVLVQDDTAAQTRRWALVSDLRRPAEE